ncbi:hypothetical protein N566_27000 [Streptomycetaceae bacterium MP113-05]|nr:hypothetical protein N566_27000 [Streptomycetaceae bacterium MP113-05]
MSIGGDEYDEQGRTSGAGMSTRSAPSRGTRTRLPGEDGDVYGVGRKPAGRPGRSLLMVVSVVVLLIAAIAFANRSGSSGSDGEEGDPGGGGPAAQPTAPSGQKPVQAEDGTTGIPSGFPQTEQGAQSAAANYAVALVSAEIIQPSVREGVVAQVFVPSKVEEMQSKMDDAYSAGFLDNLGLNGDGTAEDGMTYVSRTAPVGTQVVSYAPTRAEVEVWCTGVYGTAGSSSTNPVTSDWFTMQFELAWSQGDWKVQGFSQKDGPAPVNGDNRASGADEIADAVRQYGGFTYAR